MLIFFQKTQDDDFLCTHVVVINWDMVNTYQQKMDIHVSCLYAEWQCKMCVHSSTFPYYSISRAPTQLGNKRDVRETYRI